MLILVSPAKTLDFDTPAKFTDNTQPVLLEHSAELINQLRPLNAAKIGKLMSISDKLAQLNAERFSEWSTPFTPDTAKQAIYAFQGDVYLGLQADTMNKRDINFAQKHLRILSGLYGVLRPLDLMQAYRLEMGTRFANKRGANLYQFWGNHVTDVLNEEMAGQKKPFVLNLASNEYAKVVNRYALKAEVISPVFKDLKNGEYKLISFFAKKARGMMARYVIDHRIKRAADLTSFDSAGYQFNAKLTLCPDEPVFTRDTPPVAA